VRSRLLLAAASLVAGLAATGCGSVAADREAGSASGGKPLFTQQCGSCHTLADAGTKGTIGPNLDEAFRNVREQGYDETTIRDVVRGQIAYPTSDPPSGEPGMPANLVTGDDADDVAAYVASVAGLPVRAGGGTGTGGTEPGGGGTETGGGTTTGEGEEGGEAEDGEAVFADAGCGGCHALEAAGTSGTVGPNLDQLKPPLDRAIQQIKNGGGGMPAFEDQLSEEQIRALAEYVVKATGG